MNRIKAPVGFAAELVPGMSERLSCVWAEGNSGGEKCILR